MIWFDLIESTHITIKKLMKSKPGAVSEVSKINNFYGGDFYAALSATVLIKNSVMFSWLRKSADTETPFPGITYLHFLHYQSGRQLITVSPTETPFPGITSLLPAVPVWAAIKTPFL